ncbi:MAG: MBL fold metallo-hydrolase [Erysipelothrix sp.]|jgi:glyoxylase-like metal-dependent hydrolase (beta-lactamase superfamily II)|nr:MBL fold metallo-hydrolase [Erysipelothrix sp.]
MEVKSFALGPYQTNCYVLTQGNQVIIIDPSAKGEVIAKSIDTDKEVLAILLTHGHFDHFGGAQYLLDHFKCPIYIHEDDVELLEDPQKNYSMELNLTLKKDVLILNEGMMQIGPFMISVLHTPGHSEGSVSFHIEDALFAGDLIFKMSIGRTDLYGGNERQMMKSLKMIKTFTDNLTIYPGHGPKTTLDFEKKYNPFLR